MPEPFQHKIFWCFWVWLPCSVLAHTEANVSHVLYRYVLFCGFEFVCDVNNPLIKNLHLPYKPYGNVDGSTCPMCYCDVECFERNDCCPDKILVSENMVCHNTSLIQTYDTGAVLMISACPDNSTSHNNCPPRQETTESIFMDPPVSSTGSPGVVYRNQACAMCNGDPNTEAWQVSFYCQSLELNHLDTYEEIYQQATQSDCTVSYAPPSFVAHYCYKPGNINFVTSTINTCNVSDSWVTFEHDIRFGCESDLFQPYGIYRNVFCYMCNPLPDLQEINAMPIEENPQNTFLNPRELELACDFYPRMPESKPFKNVFCYNLAKNSLLQKGISTISIDYEGNFHSIYAQTLGEENNKKSPISPDSPTITSECTQIDTDMISYLLNNTIQDGYPVDTNDLIRILVTQFRSAGFCTQRLSEKYATYTPSDQFLCSCEIQCLLSGNCCPDFIMTSPLTHLIQEEIHFLTVGRCYCGTTEETRRKCELSGSQDDILTMIPIISNRTQIPYKNIYCKLCNERDSSASEPGRSEGSETSNLDTLLESDSFYLVLTINCTQDIPLKRFLTVDSLVTYLVKFNNANDMGAGSQMCRWSWDYRDLTFEPTISEYECYSRGDPELLWACKNLRLRYVTSVGNSAKNPFCSMCTKPTNDSGGVIDTCDNTLEREKDFGVNQYGCQAFESVAASWPYKNAYCKKCNKREIPKCESTADQGPPPVCDCTGYETTTDRYSISKILDVSENSIRSVFLLPSIFGENDDNDVIACDKLHVYDKIKKRCEPIICASGKFYDKGSCHPLLQQTDSLGFTLMAGMKLNITTMDEISIFAYVIEKILRRIVLSDLIGNTVPVSIFALCSEGCDSPVQPNIYRYMSMTLHTSFYLTAVQNRSEIENSLVDLLFKQSIIIEDEGYALNVGFFRDRTAIDLPVSIREKDFYKELVKIEFFAKFERGFMSFTPISKLLTCPQIKLEKNRFTFNRDDMTLTLLPSGRVLFYENFRLARDGSVQICLSEFEALMDSFSSDENDLLTSILGKVSLSLISLSLLCLVLTFLTYMLFPELRTLPGNNNICLIVPMFISQGLTQFGLNQTEDRTACQVLGVLLHYFWLVTFLSMNVCSFHMFRVFVFCFKSIQDTGRRRLTLYRYILYSYGSPAAIITLTVTISYSLNRDIGYFSEYRCFLNNTITMVVAFVGPVMLISCSNVIFFVITAFHIRQAPVLASNRECRRNFPLLCKLFLLTGISWITQLIDSFLSASYFSLIVVVFNASQGVFIFCAFVLNERVRNFYKTSLSKSFTSRPSSNYQVETVSNPGTDAPK